MSKHTSNDLKIVRRLSKESNIGLLFCYKALVRFEFNYDKALAYLKSDEFMNSIHT